MSRSLRGIRRGAAVAVVGVALGLAGVSAGTPALGAGVVGPTLVNADLELGAGGAFDCFQVAGWGDNAHTLTAVPGPDGAGRAAQLAVSGHTSGDRKLIITESEACAPDVVPGSRYRLGMSMRSTAATSLTVFRHSTAGWTYWTELGTSVAPTPEWTAIAAETPPLPDGTDRISFGLSLAADGSVTTDDYVLDVLDTPAPPPGDDLVVNGGLEGGGAPPTCFQAGGWGTHTLSQGPSDDTPSGSGRSWSITVGDHVSGDRKLLPSEEATCAPYVEPVEQYDISVSYKSSAAANYLTVFRHDAAGWSYWTDVAQLPAASAWTRVTASLPAVPAGTDRLSFGVSISGNGTLLTDDYSMTVAGGSPPPPPPPPSDETGLAATGRWTVLPTPMPLRTIHTTVLRDGRVLLIAGSGNDGQAFAAGSFTTTVWDPADDTFTDVETPVDMFCAGHVTLPDGRVLLQGGTTAFPDTPGATNFQGARFSYVFDPATDAFTRVNDTPEGHWYPTLTKLENGDIWAAGGLREDSAGTVGTEMFDVSAMRWLGRAEVPQTFSYWGTYPHMYLLDDGRLFYAGAHTFGDNVPGTGARLYDWRTTEMWDVPGLRDVQLRDQAGSVLLPPAQDQKVLIVGGGHTEQNLPGTRLTDIVDLSMDNPRYRPGPDLPGPGKIYVNTLNLPDRTVLASNGATGNRAGDVLTAAIYSPLTDSWRSVAADPIGRSYHSSAIVLADGRIAVFGGNPLDNSFEQRISIFEPPYLFKNGGARPAITAAPGEVSYGETFEIQASGTVTKVSLLAPSSATHQTDTNARLVDVPFVAEGGTLRATVPQFATLLPPGPYMLSVLDDKGVPSEATWVAVR